jgi:hypothetical protein
MTTAILSGEQLRLYIGSRFTGVTVVPDDKWPGMWRVRNRDHLSDMVNLARAKDAALCWARPRGLGGGEMVRWDRRETAATAPQINQTAGVAISPPAASQTAP